INNGTSGSFPEKAEKKNFKIIPEVSSQPKTTSTIKEPIQKPEPILSSSEADGFDAIINKWKSFAEIVSEEKRFTLGHFFINSSPLELTGNKLSVRLNNPDEVKSFQLNIDYLTKKAEDFFGRRFQLSPVEKPAVAYNVPLTENVKPGNNGNNKSSSGDEYVDLIINELGGEELY